MGVVKFHIAIASKTSLKIDIKPFMKKDHEFFMGETRWYIFKAQLSLNLQRFSDIVQR